jgi:hypothetical protein
VPLFPTSQGLSLGDWFETFSFSNVLIKNYKFFSPLPFLYPLSFGMLYFTFILFNVFLTFRAGVGWVGVFYPQILCKYAVSFPNTWRFFSFLLLLIPTSNSLLSEDPLCDVNF